MPDFITAEGLQIPTLQEILIELAAEQRAEIDPLLPTEPGDPEALLGELDAIFASHLREAHEANQIAFSVTNRANAEGAILDNVGALTGSTRNPATKSRFTGTRRLSVNLEPGAIVTAGVTSFSDGNPAHVFVASETVENEGASADDFDVAALAADPGPVAINAGTLTTIVTPTTGLNSVTNPTDAVIGTEVETDEAFRIRQEEEIEQIGGSTVGSLEANLLDLTNEEGEKPILSVQILENVDDTPSVITGLPPHSFEPIVWDGPGQAADDAAVCAIVDDNRPAGIANRGSVSVAGQAGRFSRPDQLTVEMTIRLYKRSQGYAGNDAVKAAVAAKFQATQTPSGIVAFSIYVAEILRAIAGVTRIDEIEWAFAGNATVINDDLTTPLRSVAVTTTADISIVATTE